MPIELAKGARFLRITVSACHTIVMKAEMNKKTRGKPVFETTSTYFVRKHWGEEYTLVTTDGMELEDSVVTRGSYI